MVFFSIARFVLCRPCHHHKLFANNTKKAMMKIKNVMNIRITESRRYLKDFESLQEQIFLTETRFKDLTGKVPTRKKLLH